MFFAKKQNAKTTKYDKINKNTHIKNSGSKLQSTPGFSVRDSDVIMVNGLDIQHIRYRH